ncbi:hypothetical protein Tco_0326639, partial [Tanacetum coccineum]
QGSGEKGQPEVTTVDTRVNTACATQMSINEDLAKKVHEEEQAKAIAEQEQERKNLEAALELQRQLDKREEVPDEATQSPVIDWNDPSVIRYHALQNRPRFVAEKIKRKGQEVLEEPAETQETEIEQVEIKASKKAGGRRKKSLARKRGRESVSEESSKKQKLEDDAEKEELQGYLNIVSEDEGLDVESLVTNPEGYDLLLWGDLKTMMEPNAEDEIWRNQQDWNLIQWKLHIFCGIRLILMDIGLVIHMMVERKYPLLQDVLSMMLQRRFEVDYQSEMSYELIRFVKSQVNHKFRRGLLGIKMSTHLVLPSSRLSIASYCERKLNTARRLKTVG